MVLYSLKMPETQTPIRLEKKYRDENVLPMRDHKVGICLVDRSTKSRCNSVKQLRKLANKANNPD
ncbi:hypothetical protein TDB9533_02452 [Thalassocella blandensis]|nr:hypothetical protein TDB9533_02452 [Thalassocella blandensis]